MLRKNKKYKLLHRRHSSNNEESPILPSQNESFRTSSSSENPHVVRRSVTVDEEPAFPGLDSEPEHLSHSSPALLDSSEGVPAVPVPVTAQQETQSSREKPTETPETIQDVPPPPLPPRRPPPSTRRKVPRVPNETHRSSQAGFTNPWGASSSSASFNVPTAAPPDFLSPAARAAIIRNVDGLMSIIDYGSTRQPETLNPANSAMTLWRPNFNSGAFELQRFPPMSQFEDPPPSYEEAVEAKEREKQNQTTEIKDQGD